jgi:hypothetical protein
LVALEDDYRAYREVIAVGIRVRRRHAEVVTATLGALEEELRRFDPHVVICSLPAPAGDKARLGWVELSLYPAQHARVRIGGRYSEHNNITLEDLLGFLDEAEKHL